jgi:hypothetical protein
MMLSVVFILLGLTGCSDTTGGGGKDATTDAEEFEGDAAGECSDGADNDQDGWFDCNDQDCFNSPDCADGGGGGGSNTNNTGTGSGTGTGGGGGGGGGGGTATGGGTGTGGTDCVGALCDLKSMTLTYNLDVDWNQDVDLGLGLVPADCIITFEGGGDFWSVDGNVVTFVGFWEESFNDCDEDQQELVDSWLGGAFHSFSFDLSTTVLLDWIAHRDEAEKSDAADPAFYITEIEHEIDMTAIDPQMDYLLEEWIPLDPIFLPDVPAVWLDHHLVVDFEN